MQYSILLSEPLVDPDRGLNLRSVFSENTVIANFEILYTFWNSQGFFNLRLVQVLCDEWSCASRIAPKINAVFVLGSQLFKIHLVEGGTL
jgi:hypothetical protein